MAWVKKKEENEMNILADELHKPIRRKFQKRAVIVVGIDDTWSADLVDMSSFAKFNKGIKYLLTIIDIFSKFAWAVPVKDKTGASVTKAFENVMKNSKRKPEKLWVDEGKEFYNKEFKSLLEKNGILMYHTFNEGKAVVIERFNRTLKNIMWKHFTANNTNKYLDVLPSILDKYNNTFHRSIKMTPNEASQKSKTGQVYFNSLKKIKSSAAPKFKLNDQVRISKYKKKFEKGYTPNWTEEIFIVDKVNKTNPVTYNLRDTKNEKNIGVFLFPRISPRKTKDF